jgi:hypothetical protein
MASSLNRHHVLTDRSTDRKPAAVAGGRDGLYLAAILFASCIRRPSVAERPATDDAICF